MGVMLRSASLIRRAGARDRALLERFCLTTDSPGITLAFWRLMTRAGGATATIAAGVAPLLWDSVVSGAARRSLAILGISHILVQLVKRTVGRPRPGSDSRQAVAASPDRFSFPSGHAAAAMSVAIGYSTLDPALAIPLYTMAVVVGASRVALGVHYPGDVAAGQLIALLTALGLGSLA